MYNTQDNTNTWETQVCEYVPEKSKLHNNVVMFDMESESLWFGRVKSESRRGELIPLLALLVMKTCGKGNMTLFALQKALQGVDRSWPLFLLF